MPTLVPAVGADPRAPAGGEGQVSACQLPPGPWLRLAAESEGALPLCVNTSQMRSNCSCQCWDRCCHGSVVPRRTAGRPHRRCYGARAFGLLPHTHCVFLNALLPERPPRGGRGRGRGGRAAGAEREAGAGANRNRHGLGYGGTGSGTCKLGSAVYVSALVSAHGVAPPLLRTAAPRPIRAVASRSAAQHPAQPFPAVQ